MRLLKNKKILLIDDAKDTQIIVRKIIEASSATFFGALTVDEGLSIFEENSPHIVLVDLNMPDKSGFDFLIHRRNKEQLKATPAIVLSGRNDQESVNRAIGLDASDYVLKPLNASLLLQKIRKHLRTLKFASYSFPPGSEIGRAHV